MTTDETLPDSALLEMEHVAAMVSFAGADVVDVGSGTGLGSLHFATQARHVVALDPDRESLMLGRDHAARRPGAGLLWVNGTGQALPFATNSFDVALFGWSL